MKILFNQTTMRSFTHILTPGTKRDKNLNWISRYSLHQNTRNKQPYNEEMGLIYRNFVKALLHDKLNLTREEFSSYREIVKYLEDFQNDELFTTQYISKLKSDGEYKKVPLSNKSQEFIKYVKIRFPEFKDSDFVDKNMEHKSIQQVAATHTDITHTELSSHIYTDSLHSNNRTINNGSRSVSQRHTKTYEYFAEAIIYFFTALFLAVLILITINSKPELLDIIKEDNYPDIRKSSAYEAHGSYNVWNEDYLAKDSQHKEGSNIPYRWPWYEDAMLDYSLPPTRTEIQQEGLDPNIIEDSSYIIDDLVSHTDTAYKSIKDKTVKAYTVMENAIQDASYKDKDVPLELAKNDIIKYPHNSRKSSWWFPMLDFNNLNYFPSLFEDLTHSNNSYVISKDNLSITQRSTESFTEQCKTNKALTNEYIHTIDKNKALVEIYDSNSNVSQNRPVSLYSNTESEPRVPSIKEKIYPPMIDASYIENQYTPTRTQRTTSPISLSRESVSTTFSKYFWYEDITAKNPINNVTQHTDKKSVNFRDPITSKTNSISNSLISTDSLIVPDVNNHQIEPLNPFIDDLESITRKTKAIEKYEQFPIDLDPMVPDVGASKIYPPDLDDIDLVNNTEGKNILHKLSTDFKHTSMEDIHNDLFKTKALIEDKNKLIYDLEMGTIDLDFRITTISKEYSNLTKEKLELTKEYNKSNNNVSSSIVDRYMNAYNSLINGEYNTASKIQDIKNKLRFLDEAKLNLLEEVNKNNKAINKLKYERVFLEQLVEKYEKVTGNITKTPLP